MTIEAYTIASRLTLTGDAPRKLREYLQIVRRVEQATETLTKRFRVLNDNLTKQSEIINKLNPRLGRFYGEFSRLKEESRSTSQVFSGLNEKFTTFNNRMGNAEVRIDSLIRKTSRLASNMIELGSVSAASGDSIKAIGRGRSGDYVREGARTGRREASMLHPRSSHFAFVGFTPQTMAAGALIYGGFGLARAAKSAFHAGSESQLLDARLKVLNEPDVEAKQKQFLAQYKKQFPLLSNNELKEAFNSSVYFISKKENLIPGAAAAAKVMELQSSMPNSKMSAAAQDPEQFLRAVEMLSGGDVKKFGTYSDVVARMMAEGISPREVANLTTKLRNNRYGLDPESLLSIAAIAKEQGGSITGTMLTNFFRTTSGTTTKKAGKQFIELGLLDPSKVTFNKSGGIDNIKPDAWKDYQLKNKDPVGWIINDLLPQINKKYPNNPAAQQQLINLLFPQTAASLVGLVGAQGAQIKTVRDRLTGAKSLDEQVALGNKLAPAKMKELSAAIDNLMIAFGKLATSNFVIKGIEILTKVVNLLAFELDRDAVEARRKKADSDFQKNHPILAGMIGLKAPSNNKNVSVPVNTGSANKTTTIQNNIHMDGKKVAEVVTQHQTKAATNPPVGQTAFNLYAAPIPVSY